MRRLLTLALGAGIGYVLGTKAGHERYEQIAGMARRLMQRDGSPMASTGYPGSTTTTTTSTTGATTWTDEVVG